MNFLVIVVFSLFLLSFFVAGSLGFGFGHELSGFSLAIPAATLVVDAAVGVDPDLAAGLSGGDLRTGSCGAAALAVVFLGAAMLPEEAGAAGSGAAAELAGAAGALAAGALLAGAALAAAALDFLLLFLVVGRLAQRVGSRRLRGASSAARLLALARFFVVAAVVSVAAVLSAAAAFEVLSCCCLLALLRLLRSRSRRIAGGRLVRSSSLFSGGGLFLLGFLLGLLRGGIRTGVARVRLRLGQSRRNRDREHQAKSEHPQSKFALGVIHVSSRDKRHETPFFTDQYVWTCCKKQRDEIPSIIIGGSGWTSKTPVRAGRRPRR